MGDLMYAGFGLCINLVAAVFVVLAFSTPYWVISEKGKEVSTQLDRLGLWEICFRSYNDIRDGRGRTYTGCWWIFAREYDAIRQYIIKSWFSTAQALMTFNLILGMSNVLVGILLMLRCLPKKVQKYAAITISCTSLAIGVMTGVSCYFFGVHSRQDNSWLKQPQYRELGWSFWIAIIGGLAFLLGSMMYAVYSVKIHAGGERSTAYRAHELRQYRSDRYFR